jgi:ribosomal protein L17
MSMLRNLATSLITAREERIVTTLPKAKELRPFVERVITLSRRAQLLEGDDTARPRAFFTRAIASRRPRPAAAPRRGARRARQASPP